MQGGRGRVCSECTRGNASRGLVVKKLSVAGVAGVVLLAAPAMGAELPINAPVYAPAPIYGPPAIIALDWTGCYLGGHFGGAFIDKNIGQFAVPTPRTFGFPPSFAVSDRSTDLSSIGLLGGGQVGCNLQFARNWVIGIEADASGANPQGGGSAGQTKTLPGIITTLSSTGSASASTDFIATATGRLGYTFGRLGQGMVYAKGGAAWAHDNYQFNGQVSCSPVPCGFANALIVTPFSFSASETRVGWTVGAGVEWAMWENWSVKLEYDYLDFGNRAVAFNDPVLGAATINVSQRISEVKFGVNYRFGPPLPRY
jgi:opacity protein-like surface antigen